MELLLSHPASRSATSPPPAPTSMATTSVHAVVQVISPRTTAAATRIGPPPV
ncbi:hypothetical protein [Micromonospora sp. NPDC047187]|uniref:hypothetical protein n=1 Tax=Micromonospora sp. NPDC047187 TaxID=3155262 RepID=UPI0033EB84F9